MEITKFGAITLDEKGDLVLANFNFESDDPDPEREITNDDYRAMMYCVLDSLAKKIYAIAPPVAAGSVDTVAFRDLLLNVQSWIEGGVIADQEFTLLVSHINAWGSQQREAGRVEQKSFLKESMDRGQAEFNRKWTEQKERAEKAEAEVEFMKKVGMKEVEQTNKVHARNVELEARVKELEAEDLSMHRKLAAETLRADQGWERYEAANRANNNLERRLLDGCDALGNLPNELM